MTLLIEPDYGTPASESLETVQVEIDGVSVSIPAETSIMRASAIAGTSVHAASVS
jgi:formate dehydrogenase major subunit